MRLTATFDVCASSTSRTICARALSEPTWVARISNRPCWLMEPPIASEPTVLATGIDSPVISDSSHVELPSITRPSTGIFSPGTTWCTHPSTCTILAAPDYCSRLTQVILTVLLTHKTVTVKHGSKGDQLFLWRMSKKKIGKGDYVGDMTPYVKIPTNHPNEGVLANGWKSRTVFSFFVTTIYADIQRLNCRNDFDTVWFIGHQSQVIAFLDG